MIFSFSFISIFWSVDFKAWFSST